MIRKIKSALINKMPLSSKITCRYETYAIGNKKYLIFWDEVISKEKVSSMLQDIASETANKNLSAWKTLIVLGETEDEFNRDELLHFDGVNTIVVFYLINTKSQKVFCNKSWIFPLGMNYRKHIKKIDNILGDYLAL